MMAVVHPDPMSFGIEMSRARFDAGATMGPDEFTVRLAPEMRSAPAPTHVVGYLTMILTGWPLSSQTLFVTLVRST